MKLKYRRAGSADAWKTVWMRSLYSAGSLRGHHHARCDLGVQGGLPPPTDEGLRYSRSAIKVKVKVTTSMTTASADALAPRPLDSRWRSPRSNGRRATRPQRGRTVWLKGPFGAVPGTDLDEPATAAPDARPLDTWMRGATLELAIDPPLEPGATVSLRSIALDDGQVVELRS